jgi:hypothetical protein
MARGLRPLTTLTLVFRGTADQGRRHMCRVESQSHMETSSITAETVESRRVTSHGDRPLASGGGICRVESHHRATSIIASRTAEPVSSRVTSHGDLSHHGDGPLALHDGGNCVEASRVEAKITNNTWMNRLTLTYNKRRSPFHLPTAERLGATGGEPPQKGPRGTERVGDRRGAHSSHQAWKKRDRQRYRRTHCQANGGKLSNVSEMRNTVECIGGHTQDRMYRNTVTSHHMATDLSHHGGTSVESHHRATSIIASRTAEHADSPRDTRRNMRIH